MELTTLYRHENNPDYFWTDYNKCREDYLDSTIEEEIAETIECYATPSRMFREGLQGHTNFFEQLYADAIEDLCNEFICEQDYTEEEIKELDALGYIII